MNAPPRLRARASGDASRICSTGARMSCHPRRRIAAVTVLVLTCAMWSTVAPAAEPAEPTRGDRMIAAYFQAETRRLAEASLADVRSKDDWTARRAEARRQLLEM